MWAKSLPYMVLSSGLACAELMNLVPWPLFVRNQMQSLNSTGQLDLSGTIEQLPFYT